MKNPFSSGRGIHPPARKHTAATPVTAAPVPGRVILPLCQHIGAPAKPLVAKGDAVLAGQKIAEADGCLSVPVHASISGTVADIAPWMHPVLGIPAASIIIDSDGRDEAAPRAPAFPDYSRQSPQTLAAAIKEAGVVGLGGAAFPTHAKLAPPTGTKIDTLIINGAECEPYLAADDRLMREDPEEIVEGAKILMHILGAGRAIIAVEDNKPQAIAALRRAVAGDARLSLKALASGYPQGAERTMIKTLLKREVPAGKPPFTVGVVVDNVATARAVCRAVREGEALTSRIITVAGSGIEQSKNLNVRLGTLVRDIAAFCGGVKKDLAQVIMGGPMMGIAQPSLDVPVLKGSSGLLFLTKKETIERAFSDCFRCGKCVNACPMGLLPNMLSQYGEHFRAEEAREYHALECIECGSCSYVCPSRRPIVQQIRWLKQELRKKK